MSVADIKKSVDQKMQRSIEAFKADLAKIRTGAPIPGCSTTSRSTTTVRTCPSRKSRT